MTDHFLRLCPIRRLWLIIFTEIRGPSVPKSPSGLVYPPRIRFRFRSASTLSFLYLSACRQQSTHADRPAHFSISDIGGKSTEKDCLAELTSESAKWTQVSDHLQINAGRPGYSFLKLRIELCPLTKSSGKFPNELIIRQSHED